MTPVPPHIARLQMEIPGAPPADLVVGPKSPHDVAAVLHHATERGLRVQVWGGGTRQGYGSPPPPDIVMTTERLSRVDSWEPDDLTLVVGAGARAGDVEAMLAEGDQTAVLPEVPGGSTLGGVVAAGVSPLRRGRLYGTRERVLEVTVVTGDGRIVRAGGRVVKNVTGYDLPRACVGAFGSLGVVVSVCLKLWPMPPAAATVEVGAVDDARAIARPLAVLEDGNGTRVYLWGTPEEVEKMSARLGGTHRPGHDWPADPSGPHIWSLQVPPANTSEGVARLPTGWRYLALHGVGEIRAASDDAEGALELRSWAESTGGRLVVVGSPPGWGEIDPWGQPPPALGLQRRLIEQFDPGRVINPGRLPGGL